MAQKKSLGVDWSSGQWVAVVYRGEEYDETIVRDQIQDIWTAYGDNVHRLIVDTPIGLLPEQDDERDLPIARRCDAETRTVIGLQYRSVFNPPARKVLDQWRKDVSREDASELNREITGKGLQHQGYSLSKAIIQVDELFDSTNADHETVFEGHPEVSFATFAGDSLSHKKHSAAGVAERLEALDQYCEDAGNVLRKIMSELHEDDEECIGLDDALDALALALTASSPDKLRSLPRDSPPIDTKGRPMRMVYQGSRPSDLS